MGTPVQASPLDEFTVPATVPDHPGFQTQVHLVVGAHDGLYVRIEQETAELDGTEAVVISVGKLLELAERLNQRH